MAPQTPNLKKLLPVAAALLLGGSAVWYVLFQGRVSTDNAYIAGDVTLLSPKATGYVAKIYVEDNQHVSAGQPVVELDKADYQARVEAAKASVEALGNQIIAQQHMVAEARANAGVAAADFNRARALQGMGAASAQALDEARAKATAARAALAAALAQGDVLTSQLQQAQAAQQLAEIDLSNTVVLAPQDGVVGSRSVNVGQLVQPGSALMYLIPQHVWVDANFKETQLDGMKVGQPATVAVDAMDGRKIKGRVASFAPASGAEFSILPAENATGNFTKVVRRVPVRIEFDGNLDAQTRAALRPGLSVVVTVDMRGK